MGELVMTSYRPRPETQEEADTRVSLIVDPQSQSYPNTETKPMNGVSHQNGGSTAAAAAALKKKSGIKQKLSLQFLDKRRRCRIITAVILTLGIVLVVAIIIAVCLRSPENESSTSNEVSKTKAQNQSSPRATSKIEQSTTMSSTTVTSTTTSTTETTSPYVPFPDVVDFVTYPDKSDSRLFKTELSSGATIRTYGLKSNIGKLVSLNSISLSDDTSRDTHIRFGTRSNMASVMLSDGTYVSYDMSDDLKNLEMRIFTGDSMDVGGNTPLAFVQGVKISSDVSVLTRLLSAISGRNSVSERINRSVGNDNKTCISYLPLRVTKCGSQYPYEGAFIEGKVRIGGKAPVLMTALPWPSQPDECFQQRWESNTRPNYYIPLPTGLNRVDSISGNSEDNCESWLDYFLSVCSNREVYERDVHRNTCLSIASKSANAQNGNSVIYSSVFSSCQNIFSSINSVCSSLQYKSVEDQPTWKLTKDVLSRSLCPHRDAPTTPPPVSVTTSGETVVTVDVLAFCPSQTPFRSPEQIINIRDNQSKSVGSPIHINCEGSPEVTFVSVGHAYTGRPSLDRVMHRFKVCSICAFESSVRAVLTEDEICCDNTCRGNRVCRTGNTPLSEESTFTKHSSVYCHDFFVDRSYQTHELEYKCLGDCKTNFSVNFTMFDSSHQKTFYQQKVSCHEQNSNECKMAFGR